MHSFYNWLILAHTGFKIESYKGKDGDIHEIINLFANHL
jgi:hypothetical protein